MEAICGNDRLIGDDRPQQGHGSCILPGWSSLVLGMAPLMSFTVCAVIVKVALEQHVEVE